jgi:DNA-binding NarL/FixJ family response regulator
MMFTPSPAEQRVVDLLLQDFSNKEIAEKLGLSYRTIKVHFGRMYLRAGIEATKRSGEKRLKLVSMFQRPENGQVDGSN